MKRLVSGMKYEAEETQENLSQHSSVCISLK